MPCDLILGICSLGLKPRSLSPDSVTHIKYVGPGKSRLTDFDSPVSTRKYLQPVLEVVIDINGGLNENVEEHQLLTW